MFMKYGEGCYSWFWQHTIVSACRVVVGSACGLSATGVLSPKNLPDSIRTWHTKDACISFRRRHAKLKLLHNVDQHIKYLIKD